MLRRLRNITFLNLINTLELEKVLEGTGAECKSVPVSSPPLHQRSPFQRLIIFSGAEKKKLDMEIFCCRKRHLVMFHFGF